MPKLHVVLALALACSPSQAFTTTGTHAFVGRSTRPLSAYNTEHNSLLDFDGEHRSNSARGISSSELRHMNEQAQRQQEEPTPPPSRFVSGDALQKLRLEVLNLHQELQTARSTLDTERVAELEQAIWQAQQVDAEFVYTVSKERADAAERAGRANQAAEYRREAKRARSALPQYNLEGLWVGKFGQGFEMINVTYVGDTLIAYKVTGDRNVPKGEVSFSVDLSARSDLLAPIELDSAAAEQWGSQYLPRFAGQGQVAQTGFVNSQWLEGQLILVNHYFSFAWLPIGHQVFFGRPSPELTLKLLRESRSKTFADDAIRQHLERCLEETILLDDEMEVSDGVFQSHKQDDYYEQEGCWE